jgi:hypothetical protein
MAESAFGVEHGEVSKAIKLPGFPKMPSLGKKPLLRPKTTRTFRVGSAQGQITAKGPSAFMNPKSKVTTLAGNTSTVGGGLNRTGKTAVAGVGIGGAGATGVGIGMHQKKKPGQV